MNLLTLQCLSSCCHSLQKLCAFLVFNHLRNQTHVSRGRAEGSAEISYRLEREEKLGERRGRGERQYHYSHGNHNRPQ